MYIVKVMVPDVSYKMGPRDKIGSLDVGEYKEGKLFMHSTIILRQT